MSTIIKFAEVISTYDPLDGGRIKAKTDSDKRKEEADIPYAFPLLPKQLQVIPKKGECVMILVPNTDRADSKRFYLGPIISQVQDFSKGEYVNGLGIATSMIMNADEETISHQARKGISNFKEVTNGAFPNNEDIAIVGRESEDIILKDDEIDIRCGIRVEANGKNDKDMVGKIIFNKEGNPTYIQLRHDENGLFEDVKSVANIVADKINLISHKNERNLEQGKFDLKDQDELIIKDKLKNILEELHQVPYGDKVVEALELITQAILTHVHRYPGEPPVIYGATEALSNETFDDLLSPNVRIS